MIRMRYFRIGPCNWIIALLLVAVMAPVTFIRLSQAQTIQEIPLNRNFSKVVSLPFPAHTIVVGNSKIAAAVVGPVANTIIVTGIRIGATDLLVLDDKGKVFLEALIAVTSGDAPKTPGASQESGKQSISVRYPSSSKSSREGGSAVLRTFACDPQCIQLPERAAQPVASPASGTAATPAED